MLIERQSNRSAQSRKEGTGFNLSSVETIEDLAKALKHQPEMKKDGTISLLEKSESYRKQVRAPGKKINAKSIQHIENQQKYRQVNLKEKKNPKNLYDKSETIQ